MHTSIRRISSAPSFLVIYVQLGYVKEIGVQHNGLRSLAVLLHQLHKNHRTYINIDEIADENLFKLIFPVWFITKCSFYLFTFHATLLCLHCNDDSYRPEWNPKWIFLSKIDQNHKSTIALLEQAIVLSVWALWFWCCSKYLLFSTTCCSFYCSFVLLVLICESILIWWGGTEK